MLCAMLVCILERPVLLIESPDTCPCEKSGSVPIHSQCFAGQHVLVWTVAGLDARALDGRAAERHLVVWVVHRLPTLVSKGIISWRSTHVSLYLSQKPKLRLLITAYKEITIFQMPAGDDFVSPQ